MIAISFEGVYKTYNTSKGKYGLLRDALGENFFGFFKKKHSPGKNRSFGNRIAALKNVSFSIASGETVGIIGRNGAGKSTILKLISKITYPEKGEIKTLGRIGAFIELGAGLHHELTGRENIYLYASILGMRRKEIDDNFDRIVNFSQIRRFLDLPIKKYSSGMYSRLGFSVCAFCNPNILLVDEVLAVGDINFQKKCLAKMNEFKREGRTIVFVSHDMNAIGSICDRVIYLEKGKIRKVGKTDQVIDMYLKKAKSDFNLEN